MAAALELPYLPSAVQVRLGGVKGVLQLDLRLAGVLVQVSGTHAG